MKNYYQEKYCNLCKTGEKPFEEVVKILLYQSAKPKLPDGQNKYQHFWEADFIQKLSNQHLQNPHYRIAFAQYLRYGNIDFALCQQIANICPVSFVVAARQSGIISNWQYTDWKLFSQFCHQSPHIELRSFMVVTEKLRQHYQERLSSYLSLKSSLDLKKVTALLYSSLYAYQYLMPEADEKIRIPYQIDLECPPSVQDLWQASDEIVYESLPDNKPITEEYLVFLLGEKLMPFLTGENLTKALLQEYDKYKQLTALRVELDLYQNFVLNAFCYQTETQYLFENDQLALIKGGASNEGDLFFKKNGILGCYWLWRGAQKASKSPDIFRVNPTDDNLGAFAEAQGIALHLQEIFGIHENFSKRQSFDLFESILTLTLSKAFYRQAYIDVFMQHRNKGLSAQKAVLIMLMDGIMQGENRMPIAFAELDRKADRMSNWLCSGRKTSKKKQMLEILNFWSQNLRAMQKNSYAELPYYQSDDMVIELPYRFGRQNLHTTVINHFRRLNKNRSNLREEINEMEIQFAELFRGHGWQTWAQYCPDSSEVGEIDLIVYSGNHVLVMELKSSFIKQTVREISEYKMFVLNKAAYQLSRKLEYIKTVWLPAQGLVEESVSLHSWIVDTTLEFDHQFIGRHLKISAEELLIHLRQHTNFKDEMTNFDKSASGGSFSLNQLIDDVEDNRFWFNVLSNYDEWMNG